MSSTGFNKGTSNSFETLNGMIDVTNMNDDEIMRKVIDLAALGINLSLIHI